MRCFVMFLLLIGFMPASVHAVGPATITIASWNIQQFGPGKSDDPVRLQRIAEVIKEFDVVAIQEITDKDVLGRPVIDGLTKILRAEYRRSYAGILGPRTGCEDGRLEQYAILFDSEILQEVHSETLPGDPNHPDKMCHNPLVATFRLSDTEGRFTFTLVVVHTDPVPVSALIEDLNGLGRIFQMVQARDAKDNDVILVGDLNADPSHLEGLGAVPDLVYGIPDQPTMVNRTSRNDNILFQWEPTGEDFTGTAGVFPIVSFLQISDAVANQLSDHLPVYAEFFTRRDSR